MYTHTYETKFISSILLYAIFLKFSAYLIINKGQWENAHNLPTTRTYIRNGLPSPVCYGRSVISQRGILRFRASSSNTTSVEGSYTNEENMLDETRMIFNDNAVMKQQLPITLTSSTVTYQEKYNHDMYNLKPHQH